MAFMLFLPVLKTAAYGQFSSTEFSNSHRPAPKREKACSRYYKLGNSCPNWLQLPGPITPRRPLSHDSLLGLGQPYALLLLSLFQPDIPGNASHRTQDQRSSPATSRKYPF